MTTGLNDEINQTSSEQLTELNKLFAKRYTEDDSEYREMGHRRNSPPIVDDWPGQQHNSRAQRFRYNNNNNNQRQNYFNNREHYSNHSNDRRSHRDYSDHRQQRQHSHYSNNQRSYQDFSDDQPTYRNFSNDRRSHRDYPDNQYGSHRNDRYRDRSPHRHHQQRR